MHAFLWLAPLTLLLLTIKLILSKRSSVKLPPSPWKLPFIGNLHQLGLLPHQSLDKLAKKHGPLMLLKLGQVPTLVVSSSQMAREILKTHDLIFASRPILRTAEILLYGGKDMGFAPYGEHWRQMRKICVINLFNAKKVQSFQAAREEEVAHLMDKISQACSLHPLEPLNMSQLLNLFSNDITCRALMGKFSGEEGRNILFHKLIEENILLLSGFNLVDYFPSLGWLSSLLGLDERAKRISSKWEAVLCQIIQEHSIRNGEKTKDDGFVDTLLSLQKDPNMEISLTDEIIKALLMGFISVRLPSSGLAGGCWFSTLVGSSVSPFIFRCSSHSDSKVELLSRVKHSNLVCLVGYCEDRKISCLEAKLQKNPSPREPWKLRKLGIFQVKRHGEHGSDLIHHPQIVNMRRSRLMLHISHPLMKMKKHKILTWAVKQPRMISTMKYIKGNVQEILTKQYPLQQIQMTES